MFIGNAINIWTAGVGGGTGTGGGGGGQTPALMTWGDGTQVTWGDGTDVTWAQNNVVNTIADVIIYGVTPQGVMAAIEAKRNGSTVALVGAWRERHVGGMMSGGLSYSDFLTGKYDVCNGLSYSLFAAANTISGTTTTNPLTVNNTVHAPSIFEQAFLNMLSAAGITPIYTDGVVSVAKTGAAITSFDTADLKRFNGKTFFDASYYGDLMAVAGCGYTIGRDAANAANSIDGYFGVNRFGSGYYFLSNAISVDPYVTPGVPASGLLPFTLAAPYPTVGTADGNLQAGCFRLSMSHNSVGLPVSPTFVPLPSTPPSSYNPLNYEGFARYCATMTANGKTFINSGSTSSDWRIQTHLFINADGASLYDVNQSSGPPLIDILPTGPYNSTYNRMDGGIAELISCVNASTVNYSRREQIWEEHRDRVLGNFYFLQYGGDSRIPAPMVASFQSFGYDSTQFLTPYGNDPVGFPYQLYIRTGRRMISDFTVTTADISMADGTVPRSTNTIAWCAYNIDSHVVQQIVSATKLQGEGAYISPTNAPIPGGVDQKFPVPYEMCVPKRAECTNLLVGFALSTTSEAFAAIRIEQAMMQIGQSCGLACALAAQGSVAVQDVNYATMRTQLLAEGMILPQIN